MLDIALFVLAAQAQLQSVTYTITDVNAVDITAGQAPLYSEAVYSQSGSSVGKMAANEETCIVLDGYEGYAIRKIVLSMHSDKTQGAGGMDVKVDDRRICQIPWGSRFSSSWWLGVFYNADFVNVTPAMCDTLYEVKEGQNISILIKASQNNLYVESYTLYYEKVVHVPYKITYSVNGNVTEVEAAEPFAAVLPSLVKNPVRESEKKFIAWSDVSNPTSVDDFIDLTNPPHSDTVLYAVFADVDYEDGNVLTFLLASDRNDTWIYSTSEDVNITEYLHLTSNTFIQSPPIYIPAITAIKANVGFRAFDGAELPMLISDGVGNVLATCHVMEADYYMYDIQVEADSELAYGRLCFEIDSDAEGMQEESGMKCKGLYVYYKPYSFSEMTVLVSGAHIVHVTTDGFTFDAGLLKTQMSAIQLQKGAEQTQPVTAFRSNPDGTYSLEFPFVVNAGEVVDVGFLDAEGQLLETIYFQMPLIVTADSVLTDVPDCDLHIQNEATCVIAENMQLGQVEIAPGAALVVNEGVQLSIASLRMCADNDTVARFYPKGIVENRTNRLLFDKKMDNQAFYFFSLPDTCGLSQISFSSGESAVHGSDYLIKYYDGEQRTINQGLSSNWNVLSDTLLYPGVGYVIAVAAPNDAKWELRFSLDYKDAVTTQGKLVRIYPHGAQLYHANELAAHHVGWNLVGNPSLGTIENENGVFCSYNASANTSQAIPYYSYPIERGATYAQQECVGEFPAFTSFFVQIGAQPQEESNDYFFQCFPTDGRAFLHMSLSEEEKEAMKIPLQITYNDRSDKTVIWLDDEHTSDYEIGKDLEKMMGFATSPHIFSVNNGVKLAFQALPTTAMQAIPVGAYFPIEGEYVIAVLPEEKEDVQNRKVLLTDLHTSQSIDLLLHDYTFHVDSAGIDNRFVLSVEPYSQVPTSHVSNLADEKINAYASMERLILHGLQPPTAVSLFDTGGRLLAEGIANTYEYVIPVTHKGVYFVRLVWNNKCFYLKVIL